MPLKPIETAPKDGRSILLYGEIEDDGGVVNDFETDTLPIKCFMEGWYESGLDRWYHVGRYPAHPTHWDYLPLKPST